MSFTAVQDTPITIDLLQWGLTTGWSGDGAIANHESCNQGYVTLLTYPIVSGRTYKVSFRINDISGTPKFIFLYAGDTVGIARTTAGFYVETIVASGINPKIKFLGAGNSSIEQFNIQEITNVVDNKPQNTLCYAAVTQKWTDFRTFSPDIGFSLAINTFTLYQGNLYKHQNGGTDRNNFYGVQYQSILKFVDNAQPTISKTFESISLQSNQLMITTEDGITTSLGQVSELSEYDFVKDFLSDGVSQVVVYDKESIYSANFLRDKQVDLLNGDALKGNVIIIELITTDNGILNLFTVNVMSKHSPVGSR